jgi:hypothetical protein
VGTRRPSAGLDAERSRLPTPRRKIPPDIDGLTPGFRHATSWSTMGWCADSSRDTGGGGICPSVWAFFCWQSSTSSRARALRPLPCGSGSPRGSCFSPGCSSVSVVERREELSRSGAADCELEPEPGLSPFSIAAIRASRMTSRIFASTGLLRRPKFSRLIYRPARMRAARNSLWERSRHREGRIIDRHRHTNAAPLTEDSRVRQGRVRAADSVLDRVLSASCTRQEGSRYLYLHPSAIGESDSTSGGPDSVRFSRNGPRP